MTELELLTLLTLMDDAINSNFEFWLSGSFAVLMAFFFTGNDMTRFIKWTLLFLYVFATLFFAIRIYISAWRLSEALTLLAAMDSEFLLPNRVAGGSSGILLVIILIMGTAATIYFGLNSEKLKLKGQ